MPFENFRGLHADRFFNSPGTLACIRSGQTNLRLFAIGEVSLTCHTPSTPFCHDWRSVYLLCSQNSWLRRDHPSQNETIPLVCPSAWYYNHRLAACQPLIRQNHSISFILMNVVYIYSTNYIVSFCKFINIRRKDRPETQDIDLCQLPGIKNFV